MYNASSRKDIRQAEKAARIAETARITYLKTAMSTASGRVWFHDLLEQCHIFNDPFSANPLREAYSKGERNVGLRLFSDIVAHCPDDYIQMMKEANARRIERDARDNAQPEPDPDDPNTWGSASEFPGSSGGGWDVEGPNLNADGYDAGVQ